MIDYADLFHTGIRVPDLEEAMAELGDGLGVTWAEARENPAQTLWTPTDGLQEIHLRYTYSAEAPAARRTAPGHRRLVLGRRRPHRRAPSR